MVGCEDGGEGLGGCEGEDGYWDIHGHQALRSPSSAWVMKVRRLCCGDACNSRALQANKLSHAIILVVLLVEQEDYGCMATALKHTETLNALTSGF